MKYTYFLKKAIELKLAELGNKAEKFVIDTLPVNTLNDFYETENELISFNGREIPYIILDNTSENRYYGGNVLQPLCLTEDDITAVRTELTGTGLLLFTPPGYVLQGSLSTTLYKMPNPFEKAFHLYIQESDYPGLTYVLNIIKQLSNEMINESKLDFNWIQFEKIVINLLDKSSIFLVPALLGLPKNTGKDNWKSAIKVVHNIAAESSKFGLKKTFDKYKEIAIGIDIENLVLSLDACYEYLISNAGEGATFAKNPFKYLAFDRLKDVHVWWHIIDIAIWEKLQEQPEETKTSKLKIIPINYLFYDPNRKIFVFEDNFVLKAETAANWIFNKEIIEESIDSFESSPQILGENNIEYKIKASQPWDEKVVDSQINLFSFSNKTLPIYLQCNTFEKVSNPKKKAGSYTYDIVLKGSGFHDLKLYIHFDWQIKDNKIFGKDISSMDENAECEFIIQRKSGPGEDENSVELYLTEIFSDEECTYEFEIQKKTETTNRIKIIINFFSSEGQQIIVDSNFQLLRYLHLNSSNSKPEINRQKSKIFELENLLSKNPESYLPIVISTDFATINLGSRLKEKRILSDYTLIPENDPRPTHEIFKSIQELIECRSRLLAELKNISNSAEGFQIEDLELHKHSDIGKSIEEYLDIFLKLLNTNDKNVELALSWFDKIALLPVESGITLASSPIATLTSPFHPINIAWHYYMQNLLSNSLNCNAKGCPIASVITTSNSYSCSILGTKTYEFKNYILIPSSLDYWKIHWNADYLNDIDKSIYLLFFKKLNIRIAGIEQGIKASQVKDAINQVSLLTDARERVEILIDGAPEFSEEVNNGIISWAENNLNAGQNEEKINLSFWDRTTCKSADVYDFRDKTEMPAGEVLSHLTNEKKIPLLWYAPLKESIEEKLDIGFVTKIESTNRELKLYEPNVFKSSISIGCMTRYNVRSQVGSSSLYESRIGHSKYIDDNSFPSNLTNAILASENKVFEKNGKNAFYHTPNTKIIDNVITKSIFCAVSSSLVDTSYLTSDRKNYLLWEYYIPNYEFSRDGKDGYYLLSESSNNIVLELFEKKLKHFIESDTTELDTLVLLKSISDRGLIKLSEFIYAGTNYVGDIGVLVSMILLQPFKLSANKGLFPLITETGINLIIPVDPFKNRIEYLKRTLQFENLNRPDLLLITIKEDSLYFIPIEIKCRNGRMDEDTIQHGIKRQAISFTGFLKKLYEAGENDFLWSMAFPTLMAEMISFSYDIYSSSINDQDREGFEKIQIHNILDGLLHRKIKVLFDEIGGRLFGISNHNGVSYFTDVDNDKINETLFVDKSHVEKILMGDIDWVFFLPGYKESWLINEMEEFIIEKKHEVPEVVAGHNSEIQIELNPPSVEINPEKEIIIRTKSYSRKKLSNTQLESIYNRILKTYDEHQISVKAVNDEKYLEGPASILFKIIPGRGIKINRIESLHNELKLELSLRSDQNINFTIDQGTINIDVPKKEEERYFVDAKELWEGWSPSKDQLEVIIGENRHAKLVSLNFSSANTPHLLIGGQTGSGKSEVLNTILGGLTRFYNKESLRLILVDPKGTEMIEYETSPHLLCNIGLDEDDTIEYLNMAISEMETRYSMFKNIRVRSLSEYNSKVNTEEQKPWWLIVLDEYGDLTSDAAAKKNIEALLKRIAQKGRASGIHLIVTTQNPSAEVISTNIRSNLPAQLALRVRSKIESNIILTQGGAETLNGKGDALLKTALSIERIQCALYKS